MSDLLAIAESLVERARPGEQVEVYVGRTDETEVRAYDGEVEQLASASSAGVGVRVLLGADLDPSGGAGNGGGKGRAPAGGGDGGGTVTVGGPNGAAGGPNGAAGGRDTAGAVGGRMGFAWAGSLEPEILASVLEEARDNARFATPDPDVALAAPDGVRPAPVELWDDALGSVDTEAKVSMAVGLERRARRSDPRIRQVDSVDYGDTRSESALASTLGIRTASRRTATYVSVSVIAGSSEDTQTGSGFSIGRSFADLDPDRAARDSVERATRMLGARKAASARCTVVFDPRVTSTLLSVVAGALSGEAVVKGRSFLADRMGEVVAGAGVTLVDDPTDDRAYTAAASDGEGLACRRNVLIDGGRLTGFLHDTVSARRAGAVPTGSAVRGGYAGTPSAGCRAVVLQPGTSDAAAILEEVGQGLYVQSVTGIHSGVNPVSGDFSVGAEGLMIRRGQLAEPVREITVASTLQRMLLSVVAIGSDLQFLPGVAAGQTLAVGEMQLSGT